MTSGDMSQKLIVIDIDGTLLHDDYTISPRTIEAVRAVLDAGLKVTLASGRGPRSCDPYLEQLGIEEDVITHNGGVIYHPNRQEARTLAGYDIRELMPLVEYCRQRRVHFDVNTAFDMYVEKLLPESDDMYENFFMRPVLMDDVSRIEDKVIKFTLFGQKEQLDELMPDFSGRFSSFRIIRSGETFIDCIHPLTTKAFALKQLLEKYGLHSEQVTAFGNYYNDVEMIRLAGFGVAMGNAPEDVRSQADHVTATNNHEGVAIVLENLLSASAV